MKMASINVNKQRIFSLGLFMTGMVFFLISFSTPYWYRKGSVHYGLWLVCTGESCDNMLSYRVTVEMQAVQACMGLSLSFQAIAFILQMWWVIRQKHIAAVTKQAKGAFSLILIAAALNTIGVALFSVYSRHFSYYFGIMSSVILSLDALVNLNILCCCNPSPQSKTPRSNTRTAFTSRTSRATLAHAHLESQAAAAAALASTLQHSANANPSNVTTGSHDSNRGDVTSIFLDLFNAYMGQHNTRGGPSPHPDTLQPRATPPLQPCAPPAETSDDQSPPSYDQVMSTKETYTIKAEPGASNSGQCTSSQQPEDLEPQEPMPSAVCAPESSSNTDGEEPSNNTVTDIHMRQQPDNVSKQHMFFAVCTNMLQSKCVWLFGNMGNMY